MNFFYQYHGVPLIIHNQKLDIAPHIHCEVEIIALFEGSAVITVNNKNYRMQNGDFLIVFPNIIHSYATESKVDVGKLIFSPETVPELSSVFKNKSPKSPIITREQAVKNRLSPLTEEILNCYHTSSPLVKKAYISLLTGKLLELCELEEKQSRAHDTITAVFEYCQENFHNKITQSDVANALHISESHLSHIFANKMKVNFRNYINTLRTNEACRLILQSDKSIIDIAEECGFSSLRSFNRAFIRNTGLTPTQYRKSFAGKESDAFWNDAFFIG